MKYRPANPDIKLLADQLSVLGNANRLTILEHLTHGEMQVNVLAKKLDLGQSALSQHLAIMRACDFVTTRRASQAIFYSIQKEPIALALARAHALLVDQQYEPDMARHGTEAASRG
ncbi:hypothetical protein ASE04_22960 [Rhizobium sp. Root708]|uniref:ArsR/SmtB family transcription factor n=1 Tax=Rhizobium sp. Root708 TaxID=1736592 RepID=UPI0006FDB31F|nr:metalloregulator ArsR/SmtB family transcription factor [Rhizobium sp. Root708]KRB61224.1 hypothetical protein ASE04_22960 [Rhizobium sp. Root708]